MTPREYRLKSKAYELRRLDKERDIHLQAWINEAAKAKKKAGKGLKPKWSKFDQFFNFKQYEDAMLGRVYKVSTISQRLIEFRRMKENERL